MMVLLKLELAKVFLFLFFILFLFLFLFFCNLRLLDAWDALSVFGAFFFEQLTLYNMPAS